MYELCWKNLLSRDIAFYDNLLYNCYYTKINATYLICADDVLLIDKLSASDANELSKSPVSTFPGCWAVVANGALSPANENVHESFLPFPLLFADWSWIMFFVFKKYLQLERWCYGIRNKKRGLFQNLNISQLLVIWNLLEPFSF